MSDTLDRESRNVLQTISRLSVQGRSEYVTAREVFKALEEPLPIGIVEEVLQELEKGSFVRCEADRTRGGYAVTRKGFESAAEFTPLTRQRGIVRRILRVLVNVSVENSLEYVSAVDLVKPLGNEFPVSVIIDMMNEIRDQNYVRSNTEDGVAKFAVTRIGFNHLNLYDASDKVATKIVAYLRQNRSQKGHVVMYLRMQGIDKEKAEGIAERLVDEGILIKISPELYGLA